jgi:hypothetical protein
MAGLDPAIHVFGCRQKGVDARSGHGDSGLLNYCASTTDFAQPDSRGSSPGMTIRICSDDAPARIPATVD